MEAYRRLMEGSLPEEMQDEYLSGLDHDSRPEVLPAYSRLKVATTGQVWARVYDPDPGEEATWDIFDPDRRFAGQVRTPDSLHVLHISRDAVYGVWWDSVGVEYVRAYRLLAPR